MYLVDLYFVYVNSVTMSNRYLMWSVSELKEHMSTNRCMSQ